MYYCVWDKVLHMGHYLIVAQQQTCFEPKFFHLVLQLGGTYSIMGMESHDSTLLHKLTGSSVVYGTHMTTSILS